MYTGLLSVVLDTSFNSGRQPQPSSGIDRDTHHAQPMKRAGAARLPPDGKDADTSKQV